MYHCSAAKQVSIPRCGCVKLRPGLLVLHFVCMHRWGKQHSYMWYLASMCQENLPFCSHRWYFSYFCASWRRCSYSRTGCGWLLIKSCWGFICILAPQRLDILGVLLRLPFCLVCFAPFIILIILCHDFEFTACTSFWLSAVVAFQRYGPGVNKRLQSVEEVESTTLALDRICAAATARLSCAASLGSVLVADLSPRIVRLSRRRVSWPEMMRRKSVKIAENRRAVSHHVYVAVCRRPPVQGTSTVGDPELSPPGGDKFLGTVSSRGR